MVTYNSIPTEESTLLAADGSIVQEEDEQQPESKTFSGKYSKTAAGFMAGVLVLMVFVGSSVSTSPTSNSALSFQALPTMTNLWGSSRRDRSSESDKSDSDDVIPSEIHADDDSTTKSSSSSSSSSVRKCTFLECWEGACSWEDAPFICLKQNGGPHMGCSNMPWIEGTCEDQCDLSDCPTAKIPKSADTCKSKQCPDEWCCQPQHCPDDNPYQCMRGSARFGCQPDPFKWPIKVNDATCGECCDITTCNTTAADCETIVAANTAAQAAASDDMISSAVGYKTMMMMSALSSLFVLVAAFLF